VRMNQNGNKFWKYKVLRFNVHSLRLRRKGFTLKMVITFEP